MKMENNENDIRDEYDFSQFESLGKGRYAKEYRQGTNLVHLDPDVAEVFHDDTSVNSALRALIHIAREKASSE